MSSVQPKLTNQLVQYAQRRRILGAFSAALNILFVLSWLWKRRRRTIHTALGKTGEQDSNVKRSSILFRVLSATGNVRPDLHGEPPSEKQEAARSMCPQVFGNQGDLFELGKKLSNGSQGRVFQCTRLNTNDIYAAKVLNPSLFEDRKKHMILLKREICIMRELHHINIVNIFTAFWGEDYCIIVMDMARRGDLYKKVESEVRAALTGGIVYRGLGGFEDVSKHVAGQLLEGISYMHHNHVVHRDLKLENILITDSYFSPELEKVELHQIKIADFGLSTVMNSIRGECCMELNFHMSAVGTPAYVAPEVLHEQYDQRVDFWSLGVIIFTMLCGQMPFCVSSMRPDKHKEEVSRVNGCESWQIVSAEGQDLVLGLLTVDPDKRLNSDACLRHPWLAIDSIRGARGAQVATIELPPTGWQRLPSPGWQRLPSPGSTSLQTPSRSNSYDGDASAVGVVRQISGWSGANVHCMEMTLRDGGRVCLNPTNEWCQDVAVVHSCFELEPSELLMGVLQDSFSGGSPVGDNLIFYTSASRILTLTGTDARRRHFFAAPSGWQIVGLQFQGTVLTGTHVERVAPSGEGSIEQISGRTGSAVEQATLQLRGARGEHRYGVQEGSEQGPWKLQSNELILVVEQGHKNQSLGAALVFYTSAGNIFKLAGVTSSPSARFAVALGRQLCGLELEGGRLARVSTCPANGDLSAVSTHNVG